MKQSCMLFVSLLFVVLFSTFSYAAILNVPGTYATIQAGLNAAANEDTVLVAPGIYYENITWPVKRGLTLLAAGDSTDTFIDGSNAGSVIRFHYTTFDNVETVFVEGFTIQHGNAEEGGGFHCYRYVDYTFNDLHFVYNNNSASTGGYAGGIYINNTSATLNNCTFDHNNGYAGGAITLYQANNVILNNCILENNTAAGGGGIYSYTSHFIIRDTEIKNNEATQYYGGGIYDYGNIGLSELERCRITGNTAETTGGGICLRDSYVNITDCYFENNISDTQGGGFYASGSRFNLNGCTVTGNTAGTEGGGIYNYSGFTAAASTLTNTFISNNTAIESGGGMYCIASSPEIDSCDFVENTAMNGGGLTTRERSVVNLNHILFAFNTAEDLGGAVYSDGTNGEVNFSKSTFFRNEAGGNGDGIYKDLVSLSIQDSNILNHGLAIQYDGDEIADAQNNWWGSALGPYSETQNIFGIIDTISANIDFSPFLILPDTDTPVMPVDNVHVISKTGSSITVGWDASPIPDVTGYLVYFSENESGWPYQNVLETNLVTELELTNLTTSSQFYISVKAFDSDGNESWYSKEITAFTRVLEANNLSIHDNLDLMHVVNHTPTFTFEYDDSNLETLAAHQVEVSSLSDFSTIDIWESGWVNSSDTSIVYSGSELLDGETYYLRLLVKATDDYTSEWSYLEFQMNSTVDALDLLEPTNEALVTEVPTLTCSPQVDPENDSVLYTFNVYSDEDRNTLCCTSGYLDVHQWSITEELLDDVEYWWEASAYDGYEVNAPSELFSFRTDMVNNSPENFNLVYPANGSTCVTGDTTLSWTESSDPDYGDTIFYIVLLSRTDDFTSQVDSFFTRETSIEVHDLQNSQTYWWKVRAQDTNTAGTLSSETWAINGYEPQAPQAFSLISPEDNTVLDTLAWEFDWENTSDPDPGDEVSYILSLSMVESFNDSMTVHYNAGLNSSFPVPYMLDDTDYWWRVTAIDLDGHTTLSNVAWSFHTAYPEPPHPFELDNGGINMNATGDSIVVTLEWHRTWDPDPESLEYYKVLLDTTEDMDIPLILADSVTVEDSDSMFTWTHTFAPNELPMFGNGYWTVYAYDDNTEGTWATEPMTIYMTSVDENPWGTLPAEYQFAAAYPNPFNPTMTAVISLPQPSDLTVQVFNVMGQHVATLAEGYFQEGFHHFVFDGTGMASGVYFVIANSPGNLNQVKKVVLMK